MASLAFYTCSSDITKLKPALLPLKEVQEEEEKEDTCLPIVSYSDHSPLYTCAIILVTFHASSQAYHRRSFACASFQKKPSAILVCCIAVLSNFEDQQRYFFHRPVAVLHVAVVRDSAD